MNSIHIMNIVQCAIIVNSFLINFAISGKAIYLFRAPGDGTKGGIFKFYGLAINYLDDTFYSSNKTLSYGCIRSGIADSNGYTDGEVRAHDEKGLQIQGDTL